MKYIKKSLIVLLTIVMCLGVNCSVETNSKGVFNEVNAVTVLNSDLSVYVGDTSKYTFHSTTNYNYTITTDDESIAYGVISGSSTTITSSGISYGRTITVYGLKNGETNIYIKVGSIVMGIISVSVVAEPVEISVHINDSYEMTIKSAVSDTFYCSDDNVSFDYISGTKSTSTTTINGSSTTVTTYTYKYKLTFTSAGEYDFDIYGNNIGQAKSVSATVSDHQWNDDYTIDVEPTTTSEGSKSIQCSICDEIDESTVTTIPKVEYPIESISIEGSTSEINIGDTLQLEVQINPDNTTDDTTITWESSDNEIATVDSNGKVIAISVGKVDISASTTKGVTASIEITVVKPVTNISLNKTSLSLYVDNSSTLTATLTPSDATDQTLTWSSSDESIASVDSNGKVTGVSEGIVTIKVKSASGIEATCDVNVIDFDSIFVDVSSSQWYYNTVKEAYMLGLMTGTDETHFSPNKDMSRAMVVTVLYRMAGSPKVSSSSEFSDVKDGIWYTNAITWATNLGIVSGYGNGKFGPEDSITREQMAVMLRNYCQIYKKFNTTSTNSLTSFTDYKTVSSYAKTAVGWAVDKGIITGTTTKKLNPKSKATRAECAKMLVQASKLKS